MKFALETKVGLFVIVATLMITGMSVIFGKVDLKKDKGYNVEFQIVDASGLQPDSPVFFRGVRVGTLKKVILRGNDLVATISLTEGFQIPDNVLFAVRQAGFIGQKYVELVQDKKKPAAAYLEPDKIYDGNQSVVNIDDVVAKIDGVAEQIVTLVKALNDVVDKDETKIALRETIENIRSISDNINKLIAANDEKFGDIIDNTRRLTGMIDRLIAANEDNLNKSINNIAEITAYLKDFSKSLDNVTSNNKTDIDESIKNIRKITDKLNETIDGVNNITDDINEGRGTVGMLINDNTTRDEVREVISSVKDMVSRVDNYKLFVTFGADYLINANDARGYVNLRLYTRPNTFYQLGISNTPRTTPTTTTTKFVLVPNPGNSASYPDGNISYESTRTEYNSSKLAFSLQYGHIFAEYVGLRIGIFENTLGLAADIYPLKNDNLTLSLEAYDFGNFNKGFQVYTKAMIRWHFYKGFFIQAGVEDLFNFEKRIYAVGGGVRFSDDDLKFFAGSAATAVAQ